MSRYVLDNPEPFNAGPLQGTLDALTSIPGMRRAVPEMLDALANLYQPRHGPSFAGTSEYGFQVLVSPVEAQSGKIQCIVRRGLILHDPDLTGSLDITGTSDPNDCANLTIHEMALDDVLYIDVPVSTTYTPSAATIQVGNRATSPLPELAVFDGNNKQTNAIIPLAVVEDVSKTAYPNLNRDSPFSLGTNCRGVYQLSHGDITLELSTYGGGKAALMPNPMPDAIDP